MIKGLYFKLNMDKPFDKEIYDFFQESKHKTKIDTLYAAMLAYKDILKERDKNDKQRFDHNNYSNMVIISISHMCRFALHA